MADSMVERVARAVCGHSPDGGYCWSVGEVIGCKRGRGQSYDGTNCRAPLDVLKLTCEWRIARAAIAAMREPTKEMIQAVWKNCSDDDLDDNWQAMIDAALQDGHDTQPGAVASKASA